MRILTLIIVLAVLVSAENCAAQDVVVQSDTLQQSIKRQISAVLQTTDSVKVQKIEKIFLDYRLNMKGIIESDEASEVKSQKAQQVGLERDRSLLLLLSSAELEKLLPGRKWK